MITIPESMEWVYQDRGGVEPSIVRKFEQVCFKLLLGKRTLEAWLYELNTRWLPDRKQFILVDPNDPVDAFAQLKEFFAASEYDIILTVKRDPEERRKSMHVVAKVEAV